MGESETDAKHEANPKELAQHRGIADPGALRDHLIAIDAAFLELSATRARLLNEVDDAFTGLRSSAQLFREIFFGVELPVDSIETLITRAGGPHRLIEVSYREGGNRLLALADVVHAIPSFRKCFPIKSFEELALQLEEIRESGPDLGPSWFVEALEPKHLPAAIAAEHRAIAHGERVRIPSVFTRRRVPVTVHCCCGGEPQSPQKLVSLAFADLAARPTATRWSGHRRGSK